MTLIDFCPGDYIEYLLEGENPLTSFGVIVKEFDIRSERFLKVAAGYQSVSDFTTHQVSFDDFEECDVLSNEDYHVVSERQIVKLERRYFVLNVVEKMKLGKQIFEITTSTVKHNLSELQDGSIRNFSVFGTDPEEIHTIPYSDSLLHYFQSRPREKKFINIPLIDNTPIIHHKFDLYRVTTVSQKKPSGKYVHGFKDKNGKTFFHSLPVQLDKGNYLFLENDRFYIVENTQTIEDKNTGASKVVQLKWLQPKP